MLNYLSWHFNQIYFITYMIIKLFSKDKIFKIYSDQSKRSFCYFALFYFLTIYSQLNAKIKSGEV